jgi:protein-S-isoprenylcysteine O-methyltransferase Ste14
MKWIDIPPVWLALFLVFVWVLGPYDPLTFGQLGVSALGTFLIIAGLSLMLMAVWEMGQARTTPIPHMQPSSLVSSGIFAVSRNPIYVGDVLVLAGVVARADAPLMILTVPVFAWIILVRFIRAEEARLTVAFGDRFVDYCTKTRRWL